MPSNYKQIDATTLIKPEAGKLKFIFVSSASSNPTIKVYDSATSSTSDPVIIETFTPVSATTYHFFDGIFANKGIYVVTAGTIEATVAFE